MTLKNYLITMFVATLACWAAFLFIIFTVSPEGTDFIGFLLFYVSLFLALVGTTAILGFWVRFVIFKKDLLFRLVKDAFRQSFLLSIFVIIILLLLAFNLFSWINLILLVIGISASEFFLVSYNRTGIRHIK